MFGNGGRLTGIDYNGEQFEISYISSSGVGYTGEIKPSGEVTKLERATTSVDYTDVWANFIEPDGLMKYTTYRIEDAMKSWNITTPINTWTDVPWYFDADEDEDDTYLKVTAIEIEEDVIPKSTQYMFFGFENLEGKIKDSNSSIKGMDSLFARISEIGSYMFYSCEKITEINIPSNIYRIGQNAFSNCKTLESVIMTNNIIYIGNSAFKGCSHLISVNISNDAVSEINKQTDGENIIGNNAFLWCSRLKKIDIPKKITSIEYMAFMYCKSLTNISIPDGLTSLGVSTFCNCLSLESITLPNTITSGLFSNTFSNCSSLNTIIIKKPKDSIEGAPWGAPNLTSGDVRWEP